MKSISRQVGRFVALFLTLALTLPPPAFALRPEAKAQQTTGLEELEQALRSDDPLRAVAPVLGRQLAATFGIPAVSPTPSITAGLEEAQGVFDQLRREAAVGGALAEQGYVELTPEQAARFGVEAVVGGFVVADSAKVTDAGHFIVAEQGLTNTAAQEIFPWIPAEGGINGVVDSAKDTEAATGDLLLVKPAEGISVESVRGFLSQRGYSDLNAPRVAIGDESRVAALPPASFQLLAGQKGIPPVVFLNVAVKLTDEAGNTYTLILMA